MIPFIVRARERCRVNARYRIKEDDNERFSVSKIRVNYQYPREYPDGHYHPFVVIGEAPGAEDEKKKRLFVGPSGKLFDHWLSQAGFERSEIFIANTFRYRPNKDDVRKFFRPKGYPNVALCEDLSSKMSLYLIEHFRPDIDYLKKTLLDLRPEVVVTLGQTPLWAMLNQDVSIVRLIDPQEPHFCTLDVAGQSVRFLLLPAYHPSYILRTGDKKAEAISILALKKAKKILRPASL